MSGRRVPLSRQTSRIVWPARPVYCLPSTSTVNVGGGQAALRSLGLEQSLDREVGRYFVAELRQGVSHALVAVVIAGLATRTGLQTPAGHVPCVKCASNSSAKYRIPLSSGFGAQNSRPHSAASRTSAARSWRFWGSEGRDRPLVARMPISYRRRTPMRTRDRLAARLVRQVALERGSHIDQARIGARYDQRPGAPDRALFVECGSRVQRVELSSGEEATCRATDEDRLAFSEPARDVEQPADAHAQRHLGDTRAFGRRR